MNSNPSTRWPERTRIGAGQGVASRYVRENFEPDDRLAVVLLNKRSGDVIQRLASAEKIAEKDFQAWLRYQNANRYDVFISMNALSRSARGRTKADVEAIRHVYLDFDHEGTAAVETLLEREDLPKPNYLINTSPDKWQVVWRVREFNKDQAEQLQQTLVHELRADAAATDCARVLRVPGFYNYKYGEPFRVAVQEHAGETYTPDRFPKLPADGSTPRRDYGNRRTATGQTKSPKISHSERDWAYARRALARAHTQEMVIAAIASYRRFDKHDPHYYAEHTVHKAAQSLSAELTPPDAANNQPDR